MRLFASQNHRSQSVDIEVLFRVALLPLFILIGMFVLYSIFYRYVHLKKQKTSPLRVKRDNFSWKNAWQGIAAVRYELPLPLLIYGGIYTGLFTVLETSVIIALYVIVVVFFIQRDLNLKREGIAVLTESAKLSGVIFLIIIGAMVFKEYFVQEQIPEKIFQFLSATLTHKVTFLMGINLFLLLVGCFFGYFFRRF